MSEALASVGEAITGIFAWFTQTLTAIETAILASWILQIVFGISAALLAFLLIRLVVNLVRGFIRK